MKAIVNRSPEISNIKSSPILVLIYLDRNNKAIGIVPAIRSEMNPKSFVFMTFCLTVLKISLWLLRHRAELCCAVKITGCRLSFVKSIQLF